MSNLKAQARLDATSLYLFVSSISDKCERLNRTLIYPASSERFFAYISRLAAATKVHLQQSLGTLDKSPEEYLDLRDEIATLRSSWGFMHRFVKPVLDADTLTLPTSLLDGLKARFRQLKDFSETDFIFYHSTYLNYFNVKLGEFNQRANKISRMVKGPSFPTRLGLIGIPYSQSSALFINCLIPHEMGHFVFGDLQLAKKFRSGIEDRLIKLYDARLEPAKRGELTDKLVFWLEELFCDAFAVRLVGFSFPFAFVELFDIAAVLDESARMPKSKGDLLFHQYPPDLFRLKLQVSVLKTDGWWDTLKEKCEGSHYLQTLETAGELSDEEFLIQPVPLQSKTGSEKVDVKGLFIEFLQGVLSEVDAATATVPNGAMLWMDAGDLIEKYLVNGTVPSTLIPSEGAKPIIPETVSLLNASYRFYVQSVPNLITKIEGADNSQIGDTSYWSKRVEMWTAKAVEDVDLLRRNEPSSLPLFNEKAGANAAEAEPRAVLSQCEIIRRLRLPVNDQCNLVITPLLDQESFDQDSVDLRLGTHFLMPQVPPEPFMNLVGPEQISQTYLHLHAPLGSYFVLPAHQTVLGATLEFVKMPYDISGEILTKSSIARTFITIETAPWIHPSYRGCLTLEIANVSNTAIILYPGTPIGQLVLFHAGIEAAPEKLSGSYLGPVYPEAPTPKAPRKALGRLKLGKFRRPGHGWINDGKIRKDIGQEIAQMNPQEREKLSSVIRILLDNGAFPSDSGIAEIFDI